MTATIRDLMDSGNWDDYCKITGMDPYVCQEGLANSTDILTVPEGLEASVSRYVTNKTEATHIWHEQRLTDLEEALLILTDEMKAKGHASPALDRVQDLIGRLTPCPPNRRRARTE